MGRRRLNTALLQLELGNNLEISLFVIIADKEDQDGEGQGPEEAPEVLGNDNQEKEEEVCK